MINFGNKLYKNMPIEVFEEFNIDKLNSLLCIGDAKIKNTSAIKYDIFKVNNIDVLIVYKDIKLFKNKFIRLLHTPIAKNRNIDLENKILKLLSQDERIGELVTTREDLEEHNLHIKYNQDIWATDFYDILDDNLIYSVNRGKYKSKIKYTKYKDEITFREATKDDYLDIINLMEEWKDYKEKEGTLYNKSTFNNIKKNFELFLSRPFYTYVITYKDMIVSFEILYEQGNILFQLVNQAYREVNEFINKDIIDYVHKWNHKLTIDTFYSKYKIINYEYASNPKGGLYNFKNNLYQCKSPLYKLKFKR